MAGAVACDTFVAALPGLQAYRVPAAAAVVAATAVGPVMVAFGGAILLRSRSAFSYLASIAGLVVVLLAADGAHPGPVVTAFGHGPSRLLTETLPLSGSRVELTPLVVLVWVAGATAAELALRGRSPGVALLVPIGLYVLCFAAGSGVPGPDRTAGPLLLVLLAVTAVLISQRGPGYRTATGALAGTVVVAVVLALGLPTVPRLASSPAAVHRPAQILSPVLTDPVAAMALLRDGAPHDRPRPEMSVTLSAASDGYLAMAVLDDYDGGRWRFNVPFSPTGGRIPGRRPASGARVTQRVDVVGTLPAPLLPALDRPISIYGVPAADAPLTGMLLKQGPDVRPHYTVVSEAPLVTLAELPGTDGIDAAAGAASDLALPADTSSAVAAEARYISASGGAARPVATVAYLQAALRVLRIVDRRADPSLGEGHGPGDPGVTTTTLAGGRAGTALSLVIDAVTVPRTATPEQFATFFAVLARGVGVPARVVTGFRLVPSSAGGPLGAGTYEVMDRQAWAWVEVPVSGLGWVVCDPTPDLTSAVAAPPPLPAGTGTTLPPRQADAVPRGQAAGGHPLAPPVRLPVVTRGGGATWPVASLGVVAGAAGLAAAGPGRALYRRRRRRRLRRSGDPRSQAVGAWLQVLDGLERAGLRPDRAATSAEVAAEVGHHFGRELVAPAMEVGAMADRALFSTALAPSGAEVAAAWETADAVGRAVLGGLDRRQRLHAAMVVGSTPLTARAGVTGS